MILPPIISSRLRPPRDVEVRTAQVVVAAGGALQATCLFPEIVPGAAWLVFDVPQELKRRRFPPGVVQVPVGEGETMLSIAEYSQSEAQIARARALPNQTLVDGAGQDPQTGHHATRRVLETPEFNARFETEVFEPLLERTNAQIHRVEIIALFGLAGGLGSGAGLLTANWLARAFLERLGDIDVEIHLLEIGALSFVGTGSGQRTFRNTAHANHQQLQENSGARPA